MNKSNGLSLFELLTVLIIVAIIAGFAMPSLRDLLQTSYADVQRDQLLQVIQLARSEALLRGVSVSLCKSADQKICGGAWDQGQIVFVDDQESGEVQQREQVIAVFTGASQYAHLYWRAFPRRQAYLQFLADGTTHAENGTFWYCMSSHPYPRWAIVIGKSGRAREVYPDQHGKIIDGRGEVLQC
ncbi:MAG: hypothetical protein A3E83_01295 [Gammaproteobacteria bacterium RIFCSPHIGHO2_12_FULL_41_20]|nr:MAG: hypothetical protein A3E83_01295 [Gammaproteobacteria bacterium RIFCSPHIGHO2_12_FULL_41_20]